MDKMRLAACAGLLSVMVSPATHAATTISGSYTANSIGSVDPTCAPLPFRVIVPAASSSGSSNLGSFTYSSNSCTAGAAGGDVVGTFVLDFGDGTLVGDLAGTATPVGLPGLSNLLLSQTITSGTGRFSGFTGQFVNSGTVDLTQGPPARLTFNFEGKLVPAVPEPATWLTMLIGFFMSGAMLRHKSATKAMTRRPA